MKRYRDVALCLFVPALLFLSGCLDEEVRTKISADGSSEREISLKLATKRLPESAFPVPGDSTWAVEWKEIKEKDVKFKYIARKTFQTPDDLNQEYAALPDTAPLGLTVSVKKRFEWFFTYIDYDEVYTYRNPFRHVPVTDFFTREEIDRFQRGDKSEILKDKLKRWDDRNLFEEVYGLLVAEAQRRNDPGLPASLLVEKKEDCFSAVEAADSTEKKSRKDSADSSKKEIESVTDALNILARSLGTEAIFNFQPVVEQAWEGMEKKMNRMKHPDGWTYSVQMPGLVLETNSDDVQGNTIAWKFGPDQVKIGDYTMHATSRVSNIWAFVVTGIGSLVIVLIVVRASFRHR